MREKMMNFNNKTEVQKHLPEDLLTKVTILLQDTGYVTISPIELTKYDWRRFNEKVKQMGGLWTLDGARAHWSIPWSQ
ncbi:MAG: hypothetical protein H8E40_06375 [Chloroflexi bacterium]|nr:hypothetical protein [Chloroflexota bacterium]